MTLKDDLFILENNCHYWKLGQQFFTDFIYNKNSNDKYIYWNIEQKTWLFDLAIKVVAPGFQPNPAEADAIFKEFIIATIGRTNAQNATDIDLREDQALRLRQIFSYYINAIASTEERWLSAIHPEYGAISFLVLKHLPITICGKQEVESGEARQPELSDIMQVTGPTTWKWGSQNAGQKVSERSEGQPRPETNQSTTTGNKQIADDITNDT